MHLARCHEVGPRRGRVSSSTRYAIRRHLRELLSGRWQKVIKQGNTGEIHYFEHASGQVAGVKFFAYEDVS